MVGTLLGQEVAQASVVATHEVRLEPAHTAVSVSVRTAETPGLAKVRALVDALARLVPDEGAVVATGPGLQDGVARGTDPVALAAAWVAVTTAATRSSGRLVHYPGADAVRGRMPVEQLLECSAIDEVVVVGGSLHDGGTIVDTREFVRPMLVQGRVRLLVQPAANGVMVPFEKQNPTRCCEDH